MTPRPKKGTPRTGPRRKTTLTLPETLWVQLKVAAAEEKTDMSALICRVMTAYVRSRKGAQH